jgi:hypothetical protein
MGDEIEPYKTAIEVAGEVAEALVEKSGALEPPHAIFRAVATALDAFFYPPLVSLCEKAAGRIEARGLSRRAIETLPPRLLRGILEGGAIEQDDTMRIKWTNLLANALAEANADVRTAFPTILSELEPDDAALLDELFAEPDSHNPVIDVSQTSITQRASLDNLARLELVRYARATPTLFNNIDDPNARVSGVTLTAFGYEFLQACREPAAPD